MVSRAKDIRPARVQLPTGVASRFVGGTSNGAPTIGTFEAGDFVVTQDGRVIICITAGSPGTWVDAASAFGFPSTVLSAGGVSGTAQAWPSANRAYWWRVRDGGVITTLGFNVGTSSGNVSFSVNAGTAGRTAPGASRVVTGAVACPSTGDQTVALGATVIVQPGDWIGMSCDNTTATFRSIAPGIGSEAWMTGLVAYKDTAHPITSGTPTGTAGRGERIVAIYGA